MPDDDLITPPAEPEPDPRLVAIREATDALVALVERLPDVPARRYALLHADTVRIYAAQALREGA